jgi:hypothetical protein
LGQRRRSSGAAALRKSDGEELGGRAGEMGFADGKEGLGLEMGKGSRDFGDGRGDFL